VRIGAGGAVRVVRADGDLEALTQSAAEAVYARIDPLGYDGWLDQHGRSDEAIAQLKASLPRLAAKDRAAAEQTLYGMQADAVTVPDEVSLLADATRLDPTFSAAWNSLGAVERYLGHVENTRADYMRALGTIKQARGLSTEGRRLAEQVVNSNIGSLVGDYHPAWAAQCQEFIVAPCTPTALADHALGVGVANSGDRNASRRTATAARYMAEAHDPDDAERLVNAPHPDDPGRSPVYRANIQANWLRAAIGVDVERQDWNAVLRDTQAYDDLAANWPGLRYSLASDVWRAYALARLDRLAEAEALIAPTTKDCYDCLIVRGRIAAMERHWPDADRWFAEAAQEAPSMPWAFSAWTEALLARGDAAGAASKAEQANTLSPHFADPLKLWGDALVRQGKPKDALTKYDEALKYTPTWAALRQARDAAAKQVG
jgi:tetratricopeptide (TPR) repeat protein